MIHYIYRHIRLDKNEPFYIGRGVFKPNGKWLRTKYYRAFSKKKSGRNNWWLNIIAITDYDIEILFHSDSFSLICQKEKEFIKLYGRKDLGLGTLVNLTDGGEKNFGFKPNLETCKKMSDSSWVKGKIGYAHHCSKPIFVYKITGEFVKEYGSRRQAAIDLKIDEANIKQILDKKVQQCYGHTFFATFQGEKIAPLVLIDNCARKILVLDKDNKLVQKFPTATAAANFVGKRWASRVSRACRTGRSICGYYFKYENEKTDSAITSQN